MSDPDERERPYRSKRTLYECDCGHEEERDRPYEFCECGGTRCHECTHRCEQCDHIGCEACMIHNEDGWFCGIECHRDWIDGTARKMQRIDRVLFPKDMSHAIHG